MPASNRTRATARDLGSIAAAARALGCSEKTVRRRIADGSLTAFRLGPRMIRVDLREVETLLQPIPTTAGGDVA